MIKETLKNCPVCGDVPSIEKWNKQVNDRRHNLYCYTCRHRTDEKGFLMPGNFNYVTGTCPLEKLSVDWNKAVDAWVAAKDTEHLNTQAQ